MKCLILAAGKGHRLRSLHESKPLSVLSGVPLLERVLRLAAAAGADDFYVVVGYRQEAVRTLLREVSRTLDLPVTAVENPRWDEPNGVSVLQARTLLQEPFLLLMADHLFDPGIVQKMKTDPPAEEEIVLAVDEDLRNPLVDPDDVTRVMSQDGRIQNIGKGLKEYNGFDTGIFLCTPGLFSALERAGRDGGDASLSGGVRLLAREGRARVFPVTGHFWIDIDDPVAFEQAERALSADSRRSR